MGSGQWAVGFDCDAALHSIAQCPLPTSPARVARLTGTCPNPYIGARYPTRRFMAKANTKEAAEALLRELPSVVGAFVREDINGHPREIHLLIGPGPNARHLARDVRELLEERLSVPVDQRIISIAQLAVSPADLADDATDPRAGEPPFKSTEPRLRFEAIETQAREGTVLIRVRLDHVGRQWTGEAIEIDVGMGRTRAAATAALNAATLACGQRIRFQLD